MPNDQKPIKSSITRKQNLDNKPLKKAGDGTMGFMLWSIAGTVLAACSSPIFSDVADLTGGGGSSGDTQGGPTRAVTNGRWANTDIYVADENGFRVDESGTRDPNADAVGITDGAGNIIFNDDYTALGNGERYIADLNGATEISTGRQGGSDEELLSLPYNGGDLIISPLTDLLAKAYIEAAPQDMTREEFQQVTLDAILGVRPQFDTNGAAIAGTESSIVTVEDVLNADNYSPFADNNIGAELVSLASTTLGLIEEEASDTSATERVEALTNSLDDTRGQLMTEADEDVLSFTLDSDSSIRGIDDLDGDVNARVAVAVARGGLPVVGTPNGGEAIPMTEGENFVLSRANSNPVSLFGFEDPFDNDVDGQPGGEREPGQLVGIYIEAASMGGDIAVMFGDATNNVALAGADRVAASDAAIPAMTTVGGVTFYFVSEANLDRLVLRPTDGDFNTADESVNNPQIRFYVHDGEHATLADGATTLDGVGMLEIEVANVNDAPVVTDPGTALITSTSDSDLSGTFTASDIDGDTDFRWSATPTSTPYGEFSFPDPANPGAWTFTLNEAAFDALPAGMDVPLTFDITANDGNGGVSDAATLTIMLQGQNDAPTDITTSVAALVAGYDHAGIPSNGIFIATLSTVDADTGDTHTYTRGGVDGQYFSIRDGSGTESTDGTHLWLDSDAPGRVVGGTWEVVVTSTDSANAATSKTFSITRADASTNLAPTDITTTATGTSAALTATYDGNNVPDGGNGGHVVATLGTTDPNTGDTHTYSIVPVTGEASESFDINGNELILRVSASPAPGDMLEVTVRSTDAGGLMVDKTFTITRAGNADTATDTLAIASEGARAFLVINGVEFRAADDGVLLVSGNSNPPSVFFKDTIPESAIPVDRVDGVVSDSGPNSFTIQIADSGAGMRYSQARIAGIWNTQNALSNSHLTRDLGDVTATIVDVLDGTTTPTAPTQLSHWYLDRDPNGGGFSQGIVGGTDEADLVVTENTDLMASGWLQVTGATGDITFSRAGGTGSVTVSGQLGSAANTDTREYTFAGDYGDLVIDGDGDWVYTLGGTTAQNEALAALQSGGTERFVVAAMETGGAMRTVTETISIIVNEAPAPLAVASEGVRDSVVIYGVEFRQLENLPPLPASGLAGEKIAFRDRAENDPVTFSTSTAVYIVRTRDFSQADIARIWNTDTTSNSRFVATIIAEMPNIDTYDEWEAMELGGAETGVANITAGRSFAGYTDDADTMVTEDSDLTASGWLQVTGGTGDITYGDGTAPDVTVTGTNTPDDHIDTREYTYAGRYGNLVIDGDGDWVYTLGGTSDQNDRVMALTSQIGGAEIFEVKITRGGVMVEQEILITINGVGEAETGLVVTNEAVRAFVIVKGVEFRVNTDSSTSPSYGDLVVQDDGSGEGVNFNGGQIFVFAFTGDHANNFLPANIARIFNDPAGYHNSLTGFDIAAIILEENTTTFGRNERNNFSSVTVTPTLDDAVTEDDAADSTARGFLQVMGATNADTYTYTGGTTTVIGTGTNAVTYQIFDGDYGQLIVDGDGNWTYVLDNNNADTRGIAGGDTETDDFDVLVTQTAGTGTGRTKTETIEIEVNGANNLMVTNEAVRAFVIVNGVEFRINADSNAPADQANQVVFNTTTSGAGVYFGDRVISVFILGDGNANGDFSQANIAGFFNDPNRYNGNDLTNLDIAAIILEEDTSTTFARVDWGSGNRHNFNTASTALDLTVTEDDEADSTAHGFLEVTGGTGTYTYSGDFEGRYGDLIVDGNGNWTYVLDNTDDDTQGLNGGQNGTDRFTIIVSDGAIMGRQQIEITVNGMNETAAPADLVVTSQSADTTVTEDDSNDTTATGTLVVTNPPAGATYTYAGTFVGTYGELTIAANGTWTYTINNAAAQALDDGTTEVPIIVTITEVIGGVNGRTDEETITITVNGVDEAVADLVVTSQSADTTVTEDDSNDTTATGTLVVTNPPAGATYTYAGTFVGTYGELTIAANGTWTYTINNAAAQALDDGTTEVPIIVTITEVIGGVNGRTDEETITITVNGVDEAPVAPANTLVVESEGARTHLLIYGVEFRELVDGAITDLADPGSIFFPDDGGAERVTESTIDDFGINALTYSQANIASIWNADDDTMSSHVATIIEEMPLIDTLAKWRAPETGGARVSGMAFGTREFTSGTDDADLVVTEDDADDSTARGWLKVTGDMGGDITYGDGAASDVTVTGELGGASGTAAHTDTREYTYVGKYGDLVIDGDGDWVYTLGGVANSASAGTYQTAIADLPDGGDTDEFTVIVRETGTTGTEEETITIIVNGAADSLFELPTGEQRKGTDGDDTGVVSRVEGTAGAELIQGGDGDDHLFGLGGNDVLIGGPGADSIYIGQTTDVSREHINGAETVVYRFTSDGDADADGNWVATDGYEDIYNFERGTDKLVLVDVSDGAAPITSLADFIADDDRPMVIVDVASSKITNIKILFDHDVDGGARSRTIDVRLSSDTQPDFADFMDYIDTNTPDLFLTDYDQLANLFGTGSLIVGDASQLPEGLTILEGPDPAPLFEIDGLIVVENADPGASNTLVGNTLVTNELIQGGDAGDGIGTNGGDDVVIGGAAFDTIRLGVPTTHAGAETVVYRFESDEGGGGAWRNVDGQDNVSNFEIGVDKLVLVDVSGDESTIDNLQTFNDHDNKPTVQVRSDSAVTDVSLITVRFSSAASIQITFVDDDNRPTIASFDAGDLTQSNAFPNGSRLYNFNGDLDDILGSSLIVGDASQLPDGLDIL